MTEWIANAKRLILGQKTSEKSDRFNELKARFVKSQRFRIKSYLIAVRELFAEAKNKSIKLDMTSKLSQLLQICFRGGKFEFYGIEKISLNDKNRDFCADFLLENGFLFRRNRQQVPLIKIDDPMEHQHHILLG